MNSQASPGREADRARLARLGHRARRRHRGDRGSSGALLPRRSVAPGKLLAHRRVPPAVRGFLEAAQNVRNNVASLTPDRQLLNLDRTPPLSLRVACSGKRSNASARAISVAGVDEAARRRARVATSQDTYTSWRALTESTPSSASRDIPVRGGSTTTVSIAGRPDWFATARKPRREVLDGLVRRRQPPAGRLCVGAQIFGRQTIAFHGDDPACSRQCGGNRRTLPRPRTGRPPRRPLPEHSTTCVTRSRRRKRFPLEERQRVAAQREESSRQSSACR